ncbi:hypothetical protein Tco_0682260 [Tanacetum coccineum]|uniref:Uncharacterized protein n=1 Tax=Tanacetum coccineum TaxID=301880 RepID=A0ABQ4XQN9_9ASTR
MSKQVRARSIFCVRSHSCGREEELYAAARRNGPWVGVVCFSWTDLSRGRRSRGDDVYPEREEEYTLGWMRAEDEGGGLCSLEGVPKAAGYTVIMDSRSIELTRGLSLF